MPMRRVAEAHLDGNTQKAVQDISPRSLPPGGEDVRRTRRDRRPLYTLLRPDSDTVGPCEFYLPGGGGRCSRLPLTWSRIHTLVR